MITSFIETVPAAAVPERGMLSVQAGGESVLIALIDGEYFAINDICSHFHAHLSNGELLPDQCQVQCPLHDSCFDLRTGEPSEPPAEDPVATYAVRIEDGMVMIGPNDGV
jgi:nitrite reductase/ring-hydroxylating ferredoxin subunit